MASLNKMCIFGKLGKDIELKQSQNGGQSYADFSVATDDYAGKKDGKSVYETTWHSVRVFGQQAEYAAANGKKGSSVYVEGPLTKSVVGEKTYWNLRASMFILGDRGNNGAQSTEPASEPAQTAAPATNTQATSAPRAPRQAAAPAPAPVATIEDDDLPF